MSDDSRPLAVVTGGARGIGEAIVAELLSLPGTGAVAIDVNAKAIEHESMTRTAARSGLAHPLEAVDHRSRRGAGGD